jgi:hypothetical protein
MHRANIQADRLPRKAASDLPSLIGPIWEFALYFRSEFYRLFYFIIDLLTLVATI